ncbi:hypothetical protein BKP64_05670 [Marinobacter salinus]|uniref:DUF2357 domain-containing protein n=1 Tax=Marinobacter salinus TaxID=1874317 RepID=A0A1D9GJC1_9GAMM|nr:DUF2357 domain-containing protein [Marinobacter salinus]AOY87699.1 hypothetical protein BKP64_05670 [Marinobacter salinus]
MKIPVFSVDSSHGLLGYLDSEQKLLDCDEAQSYLIQVPDRTARLYADDALLEMDDSGEHWVWQPGFFAGEMIFELELPDLASPLRYKVDVAPAKHKTGREQFNEYLQQIVDYVPELVTGTEPALQDLAGRSSFVSLWLRYSRLRQFSGRYLSGLNAICERPIIRLNSQREQMPLHMAKSVDETTIQRLISNPRLLAAFAEDRTSETALAPEDWNLDVPFHEPSLDNPANRLIARQLVEVRRLTRLLLAELRDLRVTVSETKTDLMARLPRRIRFLQAMDKQLGRLSRRDPFARVNMDKRGAAGFNAVSGNPHYSMTHQAGIRILRLGLSDMSSGEQHYTAPTWEIYEAWCFVAIAEALELRFPEFCWRLEHKPESADLALKGDAGEKHISLFYQMKCRSLEKPNRYGYFSISRERRPDMVLEIAKGENKQFICLDSKYTASGERILDSMSSAHIYRDSLRCGSISPLLSIILVPANKTVSVLGSDEYWDRYGVGCAILNKQSDTASLLDRVVRALPF